MPMLHGCAFQDCQTFTLSTYCYEHELVLRAELEFERTRLAARDEPSARKSWQTSQPADPTLGV
jgi:hypothetical protein